MDGNGRWAAHRGLPRTAGHEAGEAALFDCVDAAAYQSTVEAIERHLGIVVEAT